MIVVAMCYALVIPLELINNLADGYIFYYGLLYCTCM